MGIGKQELMRPKSIEEIAEMEKKKLKKEEEERLKMIKLKT